MASRALGRKCRHRGLHIQDADPAADAEALERLAIWVLERFSPIVADHLHRGEQAMPPDVSRS